jgi:hypothetical protein
MKTLKLTDSSSNSYEYQSLGCTERDGMLWEVYENLGDTSPYFVIWRHEDGAPRSLEDFFSRYSSRILARMTVLRQPEYRQILAKFGVVI